MCIPNTRLDTTMLSSTISREARIPTQVDDKEAGRLNRGEKAAVEKKLLGAFRCFFKSLPGNGRVGRAILRHGFGPPAQIHEAKC